MGWREISLPEPEAPAPTSSMTLVSAKLFLSHFSTLLSPTPPVPFLKYGFSEVPPAHLYAVHSTPHVLETHIYESSKIFTLHTFHEFCLQ